MNLTTICECIDHAALTINLIVKVFIPCPMRDPVIIQSESFIPITDTVSLSLRVRQIRQRLSNVNFRAPAIKYQCYD
jgi:hypothetical protein